jgi:hypothetical protein
VRDETESYWVTESPLAKASHAVLPRATSDKLVLADDGRSFKGWTISLGMPIECVDALAECNFGSGHLVEGGLHLLVSGHGIVVALQELRF